MGSGTKFSDKYLFFCCWRKSWWGQPLYGIDRYYWPKRKWNSTLELKSFGNEKCHVIKKKRVISSMHTIKLGFPNITLFSSTVNLRLKRGSLEEKKKN